MSPSLTVVESLVDKVETGEKMALPPASTVLSFHKPSFVHEDSRFGQYFTKFADGINRIVSLLNAQIGQTPNRPSVPYVGQIYFDSTLVPTGKPIWWNGIQWVDSGGNPV